MGWVCVHIWFSHGCEFCPLRDSRALTLLLGNIKQHISHIFLILFDISQMDSAFYLQAEWRQRVSEFGFWDTQMSVQTKPKWP